MAETCGAHYAQHPTRPHLCAICTLPPDHEGEHDNRLFTTPPAETDREPEEDA